MCSLFLHWRYLIWFWNSMFCPSMLFSVITISEKRGWGTTNFGSNFGSSFSGNVGRGLSNVRFFPIQWWVGWSWSGADKVEIRMIKYGAPWKLTGSELRMWGEELIILNEWFHWTCESKRSISVTGPCSGLKKITCSLWWSRWKKIEISGSKTVVLEIKLISCGVSSILETVWIRWDN